MLRAYIRPPHHARSTSVEYLDTTRCEPPTDAASVGRMIAARNEKCCAKRWCRTADDDHQAREACLMVSRTAPTAAGDDERLKVAVARVSCELGIRFESG